MAALNQGSDKVSRHRQRMRAAGFRPVQFWVPDTRAPDFAEHVRQQCLKLKGDPAELDVLQFTEEAAGQVEGWQ
ncbi:MAG: antitoxin MazE family protein [Sphingobium sp.]